MTLTYSSLKRCTIKSKGQNRFFGRVVTLCAGATLYKKIGEWIINHRRLLAKNLMSFHALVELTSVDSLDWVNYYWIIHDRRSVQSRPREKEKEDKETLMLQQLLALVVAGVFEKKKKKCVGVAWAIPVPGSIRSSINDTRNHRNIDPDDGKILFGAWWMPMMDLV